MSYTNHMANKKTNTEISQVLPKINTGAGSLVNWITLAGILSGGFSWLVKKVTWLGNLNWPEAILLGIGGAMLLMFAASLSLALWRYFKPLPSSGDSTLNDEPETKNINSHDTKKDIPALGLRITAAQNAIAEILPRLDAMDERFKSIEYKKAETIELITAQNLRDNGRILELIHLIILKLRGVQLLSSISPKEIGTSRWNSIVQSRKNFVGDVTRLRFDFDREGLYEDYFVNSAAPDEGGLNEQELREYRINYHYVGGALGRIEQSIKQFFSEETDAKK